MPTRAGRSPLYDPIATSEKIRDLPAFKSLVSDVRAQRAILFLGAGASRSVGMPDGAMLVPALTELAVSKGFHLSPPKAPQTGYDLSEIAEQLERNGYRQNAIALIERRIQDFRNHTNPQPFTKGIFRILPFFCGGEGQGKDDFEITKEIYTTNWDDLLESAFEAAHRPYFVVRRAEDLRSMRASGNIIKLHGDFQNTTKAQFILSESDYAEVERRITESVAGTLLGQLSAMVARKNIVFVGYRGADPDVRLITNLVQHQQKDVDLHHYLVDPDEALAREIKTWPIKPHFIPFGAKEFFVALAMQMVEFANRVKDREAILEDTAPTCCEIYAPPGAGQGALLQELEGRARGMDWDQDQIKRIDLRKNTPKTKVGLVRRIGKELNRPECTTTSKLAEIIQNKGRIFLIFEHTEAMREHSEKFAQIVGDSVATAVIKLDRPSCRSRLILSGRCRLEDWPSEFTDNGHFESRPLQRFDWRAVKEMMDKYVVLRDSEAGAFPPSEQLAKQIYRLTGRSHPKFVREILEDLVEKQRTSSTKLVLPNQLEPHEMLGYLDGFIDSTLRAQVWKKASQEMIDSFARCLCILRRFRDELLETLSSHQVFQTALTVSPGKVFAFLEAHQSVANFAGFRETESVIRLVYSAALRMRNPTIYTDCHKAAAEEWKKIVCSPTSIGQDQILYFKEFLYHTASYLTLDGLNHTDHWSILQQEMGGAPLKHLHSYPGGIGADLLKRIEGVPNKYESDEELIEILRESLGCHYDQFRKFMNTLR